MAVVKGLSMWVVGLDCNIGGAHGCHQSSLLLFHSFTEQLIKIGSMPKYLELLPQYSYIIDQLSMPILSICIKGSPSETQRITKKAMDLISPRSTAILTQRSSIPAINHSLMMPLQMLINVFFSIKDPC